jgi:hypothetical protein
MLAVRGPAASQAAISLSMLASALSISATREVRWPLASPILFAEVVSARESAQRLAVDAGFHGEGTLCP